MTPWRRRLAALATLGALGGGGLGLAVDGSEPSAQQVVPAGGSGFRGGQPAETEAPARPSSPREREQERAASAKLPVPLARAAARLFLVGFPGTRPNARFFRRLTQREWGAVLIARENVVDQAQLRALTGELGVVARKARQAPPLVAAVQLGGDEVAVPRIGPLPQPEIETLAAARRDAERTGASLRRRGVDVVLGPSADLAIAGGPWQDRGFSDRPGATGRLVRGAVDGYKRAGVVPVVGHFPGEGSASQDPSLGVATVGLSREELAAADRRPFVATGKTAPAIQMSGALYAGYDGVTPATLDPAIVRDLRATGFRGTVVSANLTAATLATGQSVGRAAVAALAAGCDLLFVPGDQRDQEAAYQAVVKAVRDGLIPVERVRQALGRIEKLRARAGVR